MCFQPSSSLHNLTFDVFIDDNEEPYHENVALSYRHAPEKTAREVSRTLDWFFGSWLLSSKEFKSVPCRAVHVG